MRANIHTKTPEISGGVHKAVNPPYGIEHTEDLLTSNSQTCWRRTVCQNRLLQIARPQGIAALAAQGGVVTLTERSDATFSVWQFFLLTENEAPQDARYSRQESIEVRPFVPKGILSVRQTVICFTFY